MPSSILDAIHELGPSIAARSDEIEANRTLPADIVAAVQATGAFRMYVPTDLSGPELRAWDGLEVMEELGYHDGAAGWCTMIASTTSLLSLYLPDEYAKEIFDDPTAITGGFAQPAGRATVVDGGLRVTGRWQWGSGTQHCTWIGGGCRLVDADGATAPRPDGLVVPFAFFRPDDVEFVDNWDVSGLSGTGSCDYEVTDAFVPEGRWVQLGRDRPVRDTTLSRFSFYGLLGAGVASVAVGIGRRAIDELVAMAGSKRPQGSKRTLSERSQTQADVAIAEAKLRSAWSFMREAVEDTWAAAEAGDAPSDEQKRLIRLSAAHATQTAGEVAEMMYKAGGGAAVYKTSPLQRTFRDAFVATQHAMVAPRLFDTCGRMRLGLDTDTAML